MVISINHSVIDSHCSILWSITNTWPPKNYLNSLLSYAQSPTLIMFGSRGKGLFISKSVTENWWRGKFLHNEYFSMCIGPITTCFWSNYLEKRDQTIAVGVYNPPPLSQFCAAQHSVAESLYVYREARGNWKDASIKFSRCTPYTGNRGVWELYPLHYIFHKFG